MANMSQRLARVVAHDEAGGLFLTDQGRTAPAVSFAMALSDLGL
jgi:hypothetical protein